FSPTIATFVCVAVATGTEAGESRSIRGGAPGQGLSMVSVTVPVAVPNVRTRICSTVPAAIVIVNGPGDGLGTRLVSAPPLSSSLATPLSPPHRAPGAETQ